LAASGGIGRQRNSSLQERRGSGEAAPGLCAVGRALELRGDGLVWTGRGLRSMPGPAVRIRLSVGCVSERTVHATAFLEVRRAIRRRPDQGMAKRHTGANLHESGGFGGRRGRGRDAKQAGAAPQQHRVAGRLRRRDEQESLCLERKRPQPPEEAFLDPTREQRRPG